MDCPERLLIHKDGRATCSVPECVDADTLPGLEKALARHAVWVNCDAVHDRGCPVCGRGLRDRAEGAADPPEDTRD
ncbi:MAG TPA: hypothetical protein VKU86_05760 [Acidimicrobiales bacterium]|nr:hypothetical protein [Acidimicrobiales bacterium]